MHPLFFEGGRRVLRVISRFLVLKKYKAKEKNTENGTNVAAVLPHQLKGLAILPFHSFTGLPMAIYEFGLQGCENVKTIIGDITYFHKRAVIFQMTC